MRRRWVALAVAVVATTSSSAAATLRGGPAPTRVELSARWLLLQQVAIHIHGTITTDGLPLAGAAIKLVASDGHGTVRVIGTTHSRTNGAFGWHLVVVPKAKWRDVTTRRRLVARYRAVIATFSGTKTANPARAVTRVRAP